MLCPSFIIVCPCFFLPTNKSKLTWIENNAVVRDNLFGPQNIFSVIIQIVFKLDLWETILARLEENILLRRVPVGAMKEICLDAGIGMKRQIPCVFRFVGEGGRIQEGDVLGQPEYEPVAEMEGERLAFRPGGAKLFRKKAACDNPMPE